MQIPNKNVFKNLSQNKYFEFVDFKAERTQKFITLVLTLIALSFFGIFAINPTLSTIAKLRKEIEDSSFVDQKLEQKINSLTSLQQKYTLLQDDLPIIFSAIPRSPEIPLLVAQVQAAGRNSNVIVDSVQTFQVELEKPKIEKKFSTFAFSLSADGSYENLLKFLTTLTNMQRVVSVDIISITRKTGDTNLQLTFRGKAYFDK